MRGGEGRRGEVKEFMGESVTQVDTLSRKSAYIYAHTYTHAHTSLHTHIQTHTLTHTYTHTHIHTHSHTHTIYTHTFFTL